MAELEGVIMKQNIKITGLFSNC